MSKKDGRGFKPAKNYEPSRATGSASPKHRGHRPDETPGKGRWSQDDRALRSSDRGPARGYDRADRSARPERDGGWQNHPPRDDRGGFRGGRDARSNDRNSTGGDRPQRRYFDEAGAERRGGSQDRPRRDYGSDAPRRDFKSDGPRRDFGNDRPRRDFNNDGPRREFNSDRPRRDFTNDGPRRDFGNDRPRRDYGSDAPRRDFKSDGPHRDFGNDRPRRDFTNDAPRREFNSDRPRRDFGSDRPRRDFTNDAPRREFNSDRPRRDFGGEAPRRDFKSDGPRRDFGNDRPRRDFNSDAPRREFGNDRPRRDFGSDAPRREYGNDRPKRDYNSDRPARDFGSDRPRRDYNSDAPARDFKSDRPRRDFNSGRPAQGYVSRENRTPGSFTPSEDVVLERLKAKQIVAEDAAGKTFADLGLGDNIVRVLAGMGADAPFPIQAATIPEVLAGRDVLGRGRTGSGKTIAFGAPLVERLLKLKAEGAFDNDPPRERPERMVRGERPVKKHRRVAARKPKAIILAPTRELALQLDRTVQPIARAVGLYTTQVYGGVPQARQVGAIERGVDIIIGTPGRIEDLMRQGHLDLREVIISVLDEADHMCDLGFLEPVQRILRSTAHKSQKLLFSATLDQGVAKLVNEFLQDPAVHEVAGEDQDSSTIDHQVIVVTREDKIAVLKQFADRDGKTLVFTRTRAYAEQLTEMFEDIGVSAVALHGDLNQARRTRNLERLTSGRASILVATDVAARGIHVDDIDLVIQADAPDDYKTYMHRAGRTGRAGKSGTVLTIIPRQRQSRTSELLARAEITPSFFSDFYPGDELPAAKFKSAPVEKAPTEKALKKAARRAAEAAADEAALNSQVEATFVVDEPAEDVAAETVGTAAVEPEGTAAV